VHNLLPQLARRRDQIQRRADRPLRIRFGRGGGAPYRHDRVPDELLHHAGVPADHCPRDLEELREELPRRLWSGKAVSVCPYRIDPVLGIW
jgi:hypothetical protein